MTISITGQNPIVGTIALATGEIVQASKLQVYFSGVMEAEDSGKEFPIKLEHVWKIAHSRKDVAVRALLNSFVQDIDYQVFRTNAENPQNGRPGVEYALSVSCLEYLVVRANRDVFEVYRDCRKAVKRLLRAALPDFSNPALAARAWADEHEAKQRALAAVEQAQAQLTLAAPKVAFYEAVAVAQNTVCMARVAQVLKIPGMGRNNLFRRLKADHILQKNNSPYQRYIEQGFFEVEAQPYIAGKDGEKGPRLGVTTRVTTKGLQWLSGRYKTAA